MRKKKPQGTPKTTSGRVFSSNPVKPHLSFAAALRGQAGYQPHQELATNSTNTSATKPSEPTTPNVNSDPQDMVRAFTVAGQIMAELQDTASEESKFVENGK
jgi:hypothetical protein